MAHRHEQRRLTADDFIALRSLAQRRWMQGDRIDWKFNRSWRSVTVSDAPALEAADRLVAMGLAEETICCRGCSRAVIQLTEKGLAMVGRLDGRQHAVPDLHAQCREEPLGVRITGDLEAVLTACLRPSGRAPAAVDASVPIVSIEGAPEVFHGAAPARAARAMRALFARLTKAPGNVS